MMSTLQLVLTFACMIYGISSQSEPVLIVVGDSWGAFGWSTLQKVLTAHGSNLVVKSYAIV